MNIGIDIDGVLTDIHGFHRRYAPNFFLRKFNRSIINESLYEVRDMLDCTIEEFKAYWKKHWIRYVVSEPARENAKNVIQKFREDGHTIVIISKRAFSCENGLIGKISRFFVHNWLNRNGIQYESIIFCDHNIPESKRYACSDKDIDVMIDDDPTNINAIAQVSKAICFDTVYNQNCEGENIIRAHNWNEVYTMVRGLETAKNR